MYTQAKTWNGLNAEEMAEVYSRIGPSIRKSSVAPPKPKRNKTKSDRRHGRPAAVNVKPVV